MIRAWSTVGTFVQFVGSSLRRLGMVVDPDVLIAIWKAFVGMPLKIWQRP